MKAVTLCVMKGSTADIPHVAKGAGVPDRGFSLADSSGVVVMAVGPSVGVDVEHIRPYGEYQAAYEYVFEGRLVEALKGLDDGSRDESSIWLWTVYEACLKRSGKGIPANGNLFLEQCHDRQWRLKDDQAKIVSFSLEDEAEGRWIVSCVMPVKVRCSIQLGVGLYAGPVREIVGPGSFIKGQEKMLWRKDARYS